jgi:hypothetical protein
MGYVVKEVWLYHMEWSQKYDTSDGVGEGVKIEVKKFTLHWLQGIFETVPYEYSHRGDDKIIMFWIIGSFQSGVGNVHAIRTFYIIMH